jgi:hypothetical protein
MRLTSIWRPTDGSAHNQGRGGESKRAVRSVRGEKSGAFSRDRGREESLTLRIPAGQNKTAHRVIDDVEAPSRLACANTSSYVASAQVKLAQIVVVVDADPRQIPGTRVSVEDGKAGGGR